MTDSNAAPPAQTGKTPVIFYVLSVYLVVIFLFRALTPAHEYMLRTALYLEIGLDALCVVALIGLRSRGPQALFWIALVAGIGLFAIRMTSDHAWWTGHLTYSLLP